MIIPIDKLLEYKNTQVLNRYKKDYPNNKLKAEEAFPELLKYLWISQKHKEDLCHFPEDEELSFSCGIYHEMLDIDDMWHTFLLFTKDYMAFCEQFFGKYLHHTPALEDEPAQVDDFEINFSRYLFYIYDNLGEETVRKWFGQLLVEN